MTGQFYRRGSGGVEEVGFASWLLGDRSTAIAVVDGTRSITYEELRERALRVARVVRDARGDRTETIVPIVAESSIEQIVAYLGVLLAGATAAPLSALDPHYCARVCAQLEPRLVLAAAGFSAPGLPIHPLEADGAPLEAPIAHGLHDARVLLFTSGSTASPRGVMLSTANLRANTDALLTCLPLTSSDRALVTLPFYYCYGLSVLHTHLRAGASVALCPVTDPEAICQRLRDAAATGLPTVPTLVQILVTRTTMATRPPERLRYVMVSGGALPSAALSELRRAVPAARVYIRYGLTEATAAVSCLPPDELERKAGSIGRGLPGLPLAVVRPDGTPIAAGAEEGEVVVRGPHVALGYRGGDDDGSFREGVFLTGDRARIDDDGFVYLVGRVKEFIKTAGHRVAPREIEEVVHQLDGVELAAAYGLPHALRGEAIEVAVVPRAGAALTAATVIKHCAGVLPPHKVPVTARVLLELPRTAHGKVDRRALVRASLEGEGK